MLNLTPPACTSPQTSLSAGRVCDLLGKRPNRKARVVTFSHKRIKKVRELREERCERQAGAMSSEGHAPGGCRSNTSFARRLSLSRRTQVQHVNLQPKKYVSAALKRTVSMRLSTKGIKTVQKYGGDIDIAAKKFGVDLKQF